MVSNAKLLLSVVSEILACTEENVKILDRVSIVRARMISQELDVNTNMTLVSLEIAKMELRVLIMVLDSSAFALQVSLENSAKKTLRIVAKILAHQAPPASILLESSTVNVRLI